MINKDNDGRNRIIKVTIEMISESKNIDTITVRQIAQRADVGIGLINYHFKSKNNLLSIAIGDMMQEMIGNISDTPNINLSPVEKLKNTLKMLSNFGSEHMDIINFVLKQCVTTGNTQAELTLIPLLKEIYGHKKNEMDLRIIAMQLIKPIQCASLSMDSFHIFSGINLSNENERDLFIETLVDNILKED